MRADSEKGSNGNTQDPCRKQGAHHINGWGARTARDNKKQTNPQVVPRFRDHGWGPRADCHGKFGEPGAFWQHISAGPDTIAMTSVTEGCLYVIPGDSTGFLLKAKLILRLKPSRPAPPSKYL